MTSVQIVNGEMAMKISEVVNNARAGIIYGDLIRKQPGQPELLISGVVNEHWPHSLGKFILVPALVAALSVSGPASAGDTSPLSTAYSIAQMIYNIRNLSKHGAQEEATQELRNVLRSIEGHPNQSKILPLIKQGLQEPDDSESDNTPVAETLKQIKNPDGKLKWALVSKTNGRPLQYFDGSDKPSKEWVNKVERRVHSFSKALT